MCLGNIIVLLLLLVTAFKGRHSLHERSVQIAESPEYGSELFTQKRLPLLEIKALRRVNNNHHLSSRAGINEIDKIRQKVSLHEDVSYSGPCSVHSCSKDTIVNCNGLSLTEAKSKWFPRNTTIILLDNNDVEVIDNVSFFHLSDLRVLSLSNNNIKYIQQNAFRGLEHLETLNLEYNNLTETSYPPGLFDPLVSLTDLRLRYNQENSNLPGNLFTHLKNLNSLTIDANGDTFSLGNEFSNLTKLVLSGNVQILDTESFENVQHITELVVEDVSSLSNFTETALQPLHHLYSFSLTNSYMGITKSLNILQPLKGKNMTRISYHQVSISHNERFSDLIHNEGILNSKMTRYLIQICVRNFSLTSSQIYVIDAKAFISPLWKICLKHVDLSDNPIVGNRLVYFYLINFKNIEMLIVQSAFRSCYSKDSFVNDGTIIDEFGISPVMKQAPKCHYNLPALNRKNNKLGNKIMDINVENAVLHKKIAKEVKRSVKITTLHKRSQISCSNNPMLFKEKNFSSYFIFYFSNSLTHIQFSRIIAGFNLNANFVFVGLSNVVTFDIRDNMLSNFTGFIVGFDSLQTLMLSGNDISDLAEYFFDGMCNLVELDLSNCRLNTDFFAQKSARITQNLCHLKRLDLSSNMLYSLKPGTFTTNKMLEQLDLSKNRFKNIPFNLKDTPNLKMLDLRENSLPSLEPIERDELDKLANQSGGFGLFISGNVLSCGCDSLKFLHWLATTRVRLDIVHNFTCMNNEGQLSYWSISDDLEEMWRKCWGETFLSLALILLFSMVIGFLSVFVIWKNKTFLLAKLMDMVIGYKQKRREDYQIGVFIGYADKDYSFPCHVLRKYIEDELHLTTFVSDRDMDVSRGKASCIVNAINASWKIILVYTDNFLFNDEWSMFTFRSAVLALSPANPYRVMVLVHEGLEHRLPHEVVSALPEDNILVVSQWAMSYSLSEKLKTVL